MSVRIVTDSTADLIDEVKKRVTVVPLTIRFGEHLGRYEILSVAETVKKDAASALYRVLEEDAQMASERNLS